jgi:hypothetical protein
VIVILPVDPNEDLKALRRYSESPNPPTKTILYSSLAPVLSNQWKGEVRDIHGCRAEERSGCVVVEGQSEEIGHSSIH